MVDEGDPDSMEAAGGRTDDDDDDVLSEGGRLSDADIEEMQEGGGGTGRRQGGEDPGAQQDFLQSEWAGGGAAGMPWGRGSAGNETTLIPAASSPAGHQIMLRACTTYLERACIASCKD